MTLQTPRAAADFYVAAQLDTAVADLARMVAIDTSFPPGAGYGAFAALMEEYVTPLGFAVERVAVPEHLWQGKSRFAAGERVNVIASRPTGKPACGLYFHTDTVPAAAGWQREPLRLQREGDRLYGLGAADMKGCIAAVLLALRAAICHRIELLYDPVLLFCTDEEGGLYPGIRYLADAGRLAPFCGTDRAKVGAGGAGLAYGGSIINFNGSAQARIWAGCFGMFNLSIKIIGKSVHAGDGNMEGAGVNAIEGALPLLQALYSLKNTVAQRSSNLPPPPDAASALTAQLTIAAVHGGASGGQIPAELSILVNRRYPPEECFEDALAEIERLVQNLRADRPKLHIETHLVGHLIPTSDPYGPHWPRWQRAVGHGFGYAPDSFRRWGASSCSDFGYVQRATGLHEILLGGLSRPECNVHGPDEYTTCGDIAALARSVLAYLAADFFPDLVPSSYSNLE